MKGFVTVMAVRKFYDCVHEIRAWKYQDYKIFLNFVIIITLDRWRRRSTATCWVGFPVHVDEIGSSSVDYKVNQTKHLENTEIDILF